MMPTNRAFHPPSKNPRDPLRGFSCPDREADRIAQLKDSIEDWEQIPGALRWAAAALGHCFGKQERWTSAIEIDCNILL